MFIHFFATFFSFLKVVIWISWLLKHQIKREIETCIKVPPNISRSILGKAGWGGEEYPPPTLISSTEIKIRVLLENFIRMEQIANEITFWLSANPHLLSGFDQLMFTQLISPDCWGITLSTSTFYISYGEGFFSWCACLHSVQNLGYNLALVPSHSPGSDPGKEI